MERTSKSESQVEALDCLDEEIQVWNGEEDEAGRSALRRSEIIQRKDDLAKQAKMHASMGKKVTDLRRKGAAIRNPRC
jgi:hypothetical protein